jgi:hypothetical protein
VVPDRAPWFGVGMRLAGCAVLLLAGCGGLDPGLNGSWTGSVTVFEPDRALASYDGHFRVGSFGSGGHVEGFCPDGSGRVEMQGGDDRMDSVAAVSCPDAEVDGCAASSLTFDELSVRLRWSGELFALGSGTAIGCGKTLRWQMTYVGTK